MPDRHLDEAVVRYLVADCTRQLERKADVSLSHPSLSSLELELGARVQRVVQQGVDLGILDEQGRLRTEHLAARGLLGPDGKVVKDIFGRRV